MFEDIKHLRVKDIYEMDNLTQNKSWKTLNQKLEGVLIPEEKIVLDFAGINVVEPWTFPSFNDLLKHENIYFSFTSYGQEYLTTLLNKLKMTCVLEGLEPNRFETIYIERPKPKTKEEMRTEKLGEELFTKFIIDEENSSAVIEINKIYDQLCYLTTVNAILYAVNLLDERHGIKDVTIKTGRIFIQDNMIKLLAEYIVKLSNEKDIELKIDTDVEDTISKLGLHIHRASNEAYNLSNKLKEFMKLKRNMPGILVKYKKSRAVDEFGRNGKGQVISSRIAIYRGLCIKTGYNSLELLTEVQEVKDGWVTGKFLINYGNGQVDTPIKRVREEFLSVCIDTFNTNTFVTHAEWLSRNDNEIVDESGAEVTSLPFDREIISIEDCGLLDKFLGQRYHFLRAVQQDNSESMKIITDINEHGSAVSEVVTIPERIKIVLKDWGVQVDILELNKAINDTKKHLGIA